MRPIIESLFWRIPGRFSRGGQGTGWQGAAWQGAGWQGAGWQGAGWHGRRPRQFRSRSLIGRLFGLVWGAFWMVAGLGIAFSPEFRTLFIQFWIGFAQLAAEVARGMSSGLRVL